MTELAATQAAEPQAIEDGGLRADHASARGVAAQAIGAHLVGSVNFDEAEATIRIAAEQLGEHLKRIPDGEVGERWHWIAFQPDRLAQSEGIGRVGDQPVVVRGVDFRPVRLEDGVQAADLDLRPLGYAEAALESWQVFSRLKQEGVVPAATRFQVSLPTPLGVVGSFVREEDRPSFEPVYEAALARELQQILDAIPHEELAIQWDAALEFAHLEGAGYGSPSKPWFEDVWAGTSERLARQVDRVPDSVEVGVHLCYGDVAEKHFAEPTDTAVLTRFANLLAERAERQLTWVHLPVPIERDDEAFFAPLAQLAISPETELYLGLVHREDGAEGAERRLAAARAHVTRPFGVATECGFGRAPEGAAMSLFEAHRAVAAAW
ncbi:MAG: hypothetical protein LCH36_04615 [Actinobacteria bacterium]|nr:hypothetical protein [Actinomycetota bacterium]